VLARVDLDAALAAAERDLVERALVRHPRRQRLHLVQVGLVVVADAALVRPEHVVVLDAVALEHLDLPVVHADREVRDDLVLGLTEDLGDVRVEVDELHRLLDLTGRDLEQVPTILEALDLGGRLADLLGFFAHEVILVGG
jgi:hypothetical protein